MTYDMDHIVPLWVGNQAASTDINRTYPAIEASSGEVVHKYHSVSVRKPTQAAVSTGKAFHV